MKRSFSISLGASRSNVRASVMIENEYFSFYMSLYFLNTGVTRPSTISLTDLNGICRSPDFFALGRLVSLGSRQQMSFSNMKMCIGLGLPRRPYFMNVAPFCRYSLAMLRFVFFSVLSTFSYRFKSCFLSMSYWRDMLTDDCSDRSSSERL